MKVRYISPNWLGENIEDRRYCGNCGKVFSVFKCKRDSKNRIASPCCKTVFNNELICEHEAKQDCFLGQQNNCGSNCSYYKEAKWIKE